MLIRAISPHPDTAKACCHAFLQSIRFTQSIHSFASSFCSRAIVVRRSSLDQKTETSEIVSILGHELGHWQMSHTLQGFVITQTYLLTSFAAFALATELGESLRSSFGYFTEAPLITLYLFFAVVSWCSRTSIDCVARDTALPL